MSSDVTAITGIGKDLEWRYEVAPKSDSKVHLLTVGRIATHGNWSGGYGQYFIAWAPVPKRNKALEEQLVAAGRIPA